MKRQYIQCQIEFEFYKRPTRLSNGQNKEKQLNQR